jgi:hypothetical protein
MLCKTVIAIAAIVALTAPLAPLAYAKSAPHVSVKQKIASFGPGKRQARIVQNCRGIGASRACMPLTVCGDGGCRPLNFTQF